MTSQQEQEDQAELELFIQHQIEQELQDQHDLKLYNQMRQEQKEQETNIKTTAHPNNKIK